MKSQFTTASIGDYLTGSLGLAVADTRKGVNVEEVTRVGILANQYGRTEQFNAYVEKITPDAANGIVAKNSKPTNGNNGGFFG